MQRFLTCFGNNYYKNFAPLVKTTQYLQANKHNAIIHDMEESINIVIVAASLCPLHLCTI